MEMAAKAFACIAAAAATATGAFAAFSGDIFLPASAPTNEAVVAVRVLHNNMPLVAASVDGRPCTLLFDTGATHTTLDRGFVERELKDHKLEKVVLAGVTNVEGAPSLVHAASLKVGEAEFTDFGLMALDLAHLEKSVGARVDGILGMNVIGRTLTLLSLGGGEAVFVPARARLDGFSSPVDRTHPISVSQPPDPFSIDIVAERGDKSILLFVDSASSITILEDRIDWPVTGRRSAIGVADVNASGGLLEPAEGEEGDLVLGIPLRISPKIMPCARIHRGQYRMSRIGADTLVKYDILIGARRVAFRPFSKKGEGK